MPAASNVHRLAIRSILLLLLLLDGISTGLLLLLLLLLYATESPLLLLLLLLLLPGPAQSPAPLLILHRGAAAARSIIRKFAVLRLGLDRQDHFLLVGGCDSFLRLLLLLLHLSIKPAGVGLYHLVVAGHVNATQVSAHSRARRRGENDKHRVDGKETHALKVRLVDGGRDGARLSVSMHVCERIELCMYGWTAASHPPNYRGLTVAAADEAFFPFASWTLNGLSIVLS